MLLMTRPEPILRAISKCFCGDNRLCILSRLQAVNNANKDESLPQLLPDETPLPLKELGRGNGLLPLKLNPAKS
jgi:hypothetical protein